jgi:hypothetical protein
MKAKAATRRYEKPQRPAAIGPRDPFSWDRINAAIIGVDEAWRQAEAKWGVGRLPCLVSDATRLSMRRGMDKLQDAIARGNVEDIERIAPKIRAALAFMDQEAETAGHRPLAPEVWETRLEDGTVLAVVRTAADAHAVVASARKVECWTLEEIARVLPRGATATIKAAFPGALVQKVAMRDEGFAMDWLTSSPLIDNPMPDLSPNNADV